MLRTLSLGILLTGTILTLPAAPALADEGPGCVVSVGDKPGLEPTVEPLWIANAQEGPLTLERLAELGAPALWFSPREFLVLEGKARPSALPADGPELPAAYYRIREIRLKEPRPTDRVPVINLKDKATDSRLRDVNHEWSCSELKQLDRVTVRYYFYYREDRGIGSHFDDLEAIELQLRTSVVCAKGQNLCHEAVIVESASASAHGVGWYTNVLEVSKTKDTRIPLTVLVEENKHASAPDRDGDGLYMPHYDINRYTNDGWGIRDVVGTGKIGNPAYAAEQARVLRALHPENRVLPQQGAWSKRLVDGFERSPLNGRQCGRGCSQAPQGRYELRPSWGSRACAPEEGTRPEDQVFRLNRGTIEEAARRRRDSEGTGSKDDGKKLMELAEKLDFCRGPGQMRIREPSWVMIQRVSDVAARVFPGPRNQYGFMQWPQRISAAYRYDRGHGASLTGLSGLEVPLFGGWLVGKANAIFEDVGTQDLGSASVEALYTPSASRSASWYVSLGHEWRYYGPKGALPPGAPREPGRFDRTSGVVEEAGLKFRFLFEKVRIVKFYGVRVAVRADGLAPISNARLVVEVGAGSW